MNLVLGLSRILCTMAILVVGPLTGVLVAIAIFIATGMLVPGEPMYVGTSTPTLGKVLLLAVVGAIITAGLAYLRHLAATVHSRGRASGAGA